MAQYTKLANLIEMGTTIHDEDIEYITKELEEAGNDPEQLEKEILLMLKKAKTEIKIEKGKKLNKEFRAVISRIKNLPNDLLASKPKVAAAYRKLDDTGISNPQEILNDDEKMAILEFLKNEMEGKGIGNRK